MKKDRVAYKIQFNGQEIILVCSYFIHFSVAAESPYEGIPAGERLRIESLAYENG